MAKFSMNRDRTPHPASRAVDREQIKRRVDWLAWSLQLAIGLVVGSGVGFIIARLLLRSYLTEFPHMLFIIVGVALCCGAFTSFNGNRAWMATSIFAAQEPPPTRKARACSIIIGSVGVAVVLLALTLHVIHAGWPTHKSSSLGFDSLLLLLGCFPGFLLIHALRTGTGLWRFGIIQREETPLNFWIYVLLNAVALLVILSAMLW